MMATEVKMSGQGVPPAAGEALQPGGAPDPRFALPRTLFFGIGAQKSATSWMNRYLRGHPDVCLPVRKEQHYWTTLRLPDAPDRMRLVGPELARIRGMGVIERLRRTRSQRELDRAWELTEVMLHDRSPGHRAYADVLFQLYRGQPVVGEFTPDYALLDQATLREMASLGKDVRFIYIMRDPVRRLESGIRHDLDKYGGPGALTAGRLASELESMLKRAADGDWPKGYARSRYDVAIRTLEQAVPADRICYFFHETLFRQSEIDRLTDFLGIARSTAEFERRVNVGAGGDIRLPVALEAEARAALAPVYDFVRARFGSQVPDRWRGPEADATPAGAA